MNFISNSMYDYFVKHSSTLPLDKQFHFAVRLRAWSGDTQCGVLLDRLKPTVLPGGDSSRALQAIQDGTLIPLLPGNQNVLHLRQAYNDQYPLLRSAARLLYWATMLDYAYDIDSRKSVYLVIPKSELQNLYDSLSQDRQAVAILSTHAVNFMYLYTKYCLGQEAPDPEELFAVAADDTLYTNDRLNRQLRTYLLTHMIIAESMFYTQPIPRVRLRVYAEILAYVEQLFTHYLDEISLDTKLEFLVCCRLVGYLSRYETAILDEAETSVSSEGDWLIDTHNQSRSSYVSFDKSEHRSVLYLMATAPKRL